MRPNPVCVSKVALLVDDDSVESHAVLAEVKRDLASLLVSDVENCSFVLAIQDGHLELRAASGTRNAIHVDFVTPMMGQKLSGPSRKEPMARAIAFERVGRSVIDATAGLGGDAFRMATWGCEVTAIERNPVVAAMLADGVRRAMAVPQLADVLDERFRLVTDDAVAFLRTLADGDRPDVVYLDPMFAEATGKSAAVRKEMTLLRALLADDPTDERALLAAARDVAMDRVVVKRMRHAAALAEPVDVAYRGSVVRYDVYFCHQNNVGE